ncbi:MAG: glycosyltransferase family 4 protein [Acidobacteriota bacterium]|nr:glycosyltransferase family 4 protein [Acidobacteriota bacterium]
MARHLLVTNDFPPKVGGIQSYLYELWRRFEPGRAVVLTASSHEDALDFDERSGLVVERVATSTLFLPTPRALREIRAAIARHQPDLVLFDPAWPLGLLGRFLPVPYGVVVHGAEVTIPGHLPFVAASLRRVLRHAAVVIAAGAYPEAQTRRVAADEHPPVIQAPPGVDVTRFTPLNDDARARCREALGLRDEEQVVLSYSRLVPRKGFDTLIRASARLTSRFPNLRIYVGGSGRDRARLERLAARLGAPVTFLGRVDDAALVEWLGASDLFVMDCRHRWLGLEAEGFGIVFVEAQSMGRATIAGRSGGSHEAVDDGRTGVVLRRPRSARALADALAELLEDDERRGRYEVAASEFARANYDWDVIARRVARELANFDHDDSVDTLT